MEETPKPLYQLNSYHHLILDMYEKKDYPVDGPGVHSLVSMGGAAILAHDMDTFNTRIRCNHERYRCACAAGF